MKSIILSIDNFINESRDSLVRNQDKLFNKLMMMGYTVDTFMHNNPTTGNSIKRGEIPFYRTEHELYLISKDEKSKIIFKEEYRNVYVEQPDEEFEEPQSHNYHWADDPNSELLVFEIDKKFDYWAEAFKRVISRLNSENGKFTDQFVKNKRAENDKIIAQYLDDLKLPEDVASCLKESIRSMTRTFIARSNTLHFLRRLNIQNLQDRVIISVGTGSSEYVKLDQANILQNYNTLSKKLILEFSSYPFIGREIQNIKLPFAEINAKDLAQLNIANSIFGTKIQFNLIENREGVEVRLTECAGDLIFNLGKNSNHILFQFIDSPGLTITVLNPMNAKLHIRTDNSVTLKTNTKLDCVYTNGTKYMEQYKVAVKDLNGNDLDKDHGIDISLNKDIDTLWK